MMALTPKVTRISSFVDSRIDNRKNDTFSPETVPTFIDDGIVHFQRFTNSINQVIQMLEIFHKTVR